MFQISLTLVSFEDILEYFFMNDEDYFQNLLWVYVFLSLIETKFGQSSLRSVVMVKELVRSIFT